MNAPSPSPMPTSEATPDSTPTPTPGRAPRALSQSRFLWEFIRRPLQVGAVAPSSVHLAEAMVAGGVVENARVVVEYGPGTGSFTAAVLRHLRPGTKFFGIEINAPLAKMLRDRYPGLRVHEGSVADVEKFCRLEGVPLPGEDGGGGGGIDLIVSGLPWASFPESLQTQILDATLRALRPGGMLVTFGYHIGTVLPAGQRFYKLLPRYFSSVTRSGWIWRNMPPAFVVRCVKG